MKKKSRSFEIALSAMACAVASAFLMLGSLNPYLLATGYLVGAFALMVPLSTGFIWGSALAFVAASLLSLPLSLWKIVPFAVFFGLHPIVNYLQRKYVHKKFFIGICEAAKALWFDCAMLLSWFVLTNMAGMAEVFSDWIGEYLYLVIFIGGTLFFLAYDAMMFLCQKSADRAIERIRR